VGFKIKVVKKKKKIVLDIFLKIPNIKSIEFSKTKSVFKKCVGPLSKKC
jgi:hypothetical protein